MIANADNALTVGYHGAGYVEERLLTRLPLRSTRIVKKRDLFNALSSAQRRLYRPPTARHVLNCLHCDLGLNALPLVHLTNTISVSSTPWVVTYEHYLPRWNQNSAFGWKCMAAPSCRKIIAISGWAHRYQEHLLAQHPELDALIRPKMCVVTPAQQTLISCYDEKVLEPDRITFTLVGRDFFGKGGLEVLEVFSQLIAEGLPLHLTVVSPLTHGDYASQSTQADVGRARALMAQMGEGITYFPCLDNQEIIRLLTRTHVALLPTYADTYGFFALEGQAAGCPVITTDLCALPEFNNDRLGWMISIPKDPFNQPLLKTAEERQQLSRCIRAGLFRIIREICADPSTIRTKGKRALERIRIDRSPENRASLLESIFREALA